MKKFNEIYISNILECYYKTYDTSYEKKEGEYWTRYDARDANRVLFYGNDKKIVISSLPINTQHMDIIKELMLWKNVENWFPADTTGSICTDIRNDKVLIENLKKVIFENPGISLIPYRSTPEFYDLIDYLKSKNLSFITPESIPEDLKFIGSYANSKRGFRHLWSKAVSNRRDLHVGIPEGFITSDKKEAIEAAWWFRKQNRSFVLKCNQGTQGLGISFNKFNNFSEMKSIFVKELKELITAKLWDEPTIIVEELLPTDSAILGGSPSVEFCIDKNKKIEYLYPCEQIIAEDKKTFLGVYIHPEVTHDPSIEEAKRGGFFYGEELAKLGYQGYFDIDLVTTKDRGIFAVESNLRRTGGTHVHECALSLLGKNYSQKFYIFNAEIKIAKNRKMDTAMWYNAMSDIEYTHAKKSGCILSNSEMLEMNLLHVIIIGTSAKEIEILRKILRQRLE
jgi:hypothetical protein